MAFEDICKEFEDQTGRPVDRHTAWIAISNFEKVRREKRKQAKAAQAPMASEAPLFGANPAPPTEANDTP